METLVIDDDTRDGVWVTMYLRCKNCKLFEWYHPRGFCLYAPNKFKPWTHGIGVSKDKGIFCVSYWTPAHIIRKYIEPPFPAQDSIWPHSETIYWCHYLTEIGWKP